MKERRVDIYPSFFLVLTDVSEERLETGQSVFILAVIGSDSNNYVFGLASHLSRHVEASSPHQMSEMPSCVGAWSLASDGCVLQLSDEWILEFAKTLKAYLEEVK